MTALAALAAAAIAPPEGVAVPPTLEPAIREACTGAWRAVEVVLAGDVLRGRLGKTRDAIVRDAVESVLALHGNVAIRADALASLRAARDAGALDGPLDLDAAVAETRAQGAVAAGRAAIGAIRRGLAGYRDLEQALSDPELGSLLVDAARAIFRTLARDPALMSWAIGPTGSPGRDRALSAFAELASSPDSIAELDALIALPIHLDDNVQFTVYRPRAIDPGKWHQLLAFAHLAERRPGEDDLPDPVEEVQRQAAAVLGAKAKQYQPIVQDSGAAIPAEGELTFVPEFPGIEVNPPRRSFLWLESVHREEFRIRAGRELDGKTVRGRVTVFLGHIAIAEVACTVKVDAARPEPLKREPTSVRAYRKIFASYSHRDLDIVNQFETYARALGDEYLRDWVHLRTGEVWTDRLCQLIDQADAFQLFWSRNSMHSQFVRQEYEYALALNRPSFVRPTYWEDPMPTAPGLPPEALLRLHFQKLGAEMIGAAGRSDSNANVIARRRNKEAKRDDMDLERERETPTLADEASARPEDLDVTDPQYSLPDMKAAESSVNMAASAPPPDLDEEAPREPEPFDTARMDRRQDELDDFVSHERKKREIDPRKLITDPGIGSDNRAPARPSAPPLKKAMLAEPPITAPGVSSSPRPPASTPVPASPAPSAPAPSARPAPAPSAPARISQPAQPAPMRPAAATPTPSPPAQMPSPAPSRPAPGPSAPAFVLQPAQPAPMRPAASAPPSEQPAEPPPSTAPGPSISPGFAQPLPEASPIPTTSRGVAPMQPAPSRPSAAAGLRSPASPIPTTSPGIGPAPRPIETPPGAMPPGVDPAPPSMPPPAAMASAPPAGPPPASPWQRPNLEVSPYAPTMPQETYKPRPGEALFSVDPEANVKATKAEPIRPNAPRRSMLPLLLVALGVLLLAGVIAFWLLR